MQNPGLIGRYPACILVVDTAAGIWMRNVPGMYIVRIDHVRFFLAAMIK